MSEKYHEQLLSCRSIHRSSVVCVVCPAEQSDVVKIVKRYAVLRYIKGFGRLSCHIETSNVYLPKVDAVMTSRDGCNVLCCRMLNEEIDRLRETSSQQRVINAKLSTQLTYADERYCKPPTGS